VDANVKVLKDKGILMSDEIEKVEEIPNYWKGFWVICSGADMKFRRVG
jgi:hypothetical protein